MEEKRKGIKGLNKGIKRILILISFIIPTILFFIDSEGLFDETYVCDEEKTNQQIDSLLIYLYTTYAPELESKIDSINFDAIRHDYFGVYRYSYEFTDDLESLYNAFHRKYISNDIPKYNSFEWKEWSEKRDALFKEFGFQHGCIHKFDFDFILLILLGWGLITLIYWFLVWLVVWIIDGFREG